MELLKKYPKTFQWSFLLIVFFALCFAIEVPETYKFIRGQAEFVKDPNQRRMMKVEGMDPVGKEDGDINNDGKKDLSYIFDYEIQIQGIKIKLGKFLLSLIQFCLALLMVFYISRGINDLIN